jgi:hypothetical protein
LSAEEIRRRFPETFAEPPTRDAPPRRPSKQRGSVALQHQPGAQWENWYFEVGGQRYHANWQHPDGWHSNEPIVRPCVRGLPPVKVFKASVQIGRPDEATGIEIPLKDPVWYLEQVHNLVRAYVERLTQAPSVEPPVPQSRLSGES